MNKAELVEAIASKSGLKSETVEQALDRLVDTLTDGLEAGKHVELAGFGTFSVSPSRGRSGIYIDPDSDDDGLGDGSEKSRRKGRNPQTGKEIKIPAKNVVTFTPSDTLAAKLDLVSDEDDTRRKRRLRRRTKRAAKRDGHVLVDDKMLAQDPRCEDVLECFVEAATNALKRGERVELDGFGTFSISKRSARTGRNPQTGKEIKIPAKNVVKFKAGAELSKAVN
jgi:nucleoid DNA-binding protein